MPSEAYRWGASARRWDPRPRERADMEVPPGAARRINHALEREAALQNETQDKDRYIGRIEQELLVCHQKLQVRGPTPQHFNGPALNASAV